MRTLDYFYENYVRTFIDFCKELGESAINLFLILISWLLGVCLFITIPLWIIPYKLWKMKGGKEWWVNISTEEKCWNILKNNTVDEWIVCKYNADWIYSFIENQPTADVKENKDCEKCIYFGKHAPKERNWEYEYY